MNVDSKVDCVIVKNKDNCRGSAAVSVWAGLHKRIKVLEAKKATVTLEAKLCSLEEDKVHDYCVANVTMLEITSLKDILVIE